MEIKDSGDKVYIRTIPTGTVKPYTKGMTITHEHLESPLIELVIDKAYYFGCAIDDIDAWQTDLNLIDQWSNDYSMQIKKNMDTIELTALFYPTNQCHARNKGATAGRISQDINLGAGGAPVQLTAATVLDLLIDAGTVLDEQNVPETGRWIVLPAWACGRIKKSDLKDASLAGDGTSIMRNGRIGVIDRFEIYMSNLVYSLTDTVVCWHCPFGTKMALTFANQIVKTRSIEKPESTFAQLIDGLNVWGSKVVSPEAIGDLYIRK